MYDYQQLFTRFTITSISDVNDIFWNEIAYEWADLYKAMGPHGTVPIQNFRGFIFIIDDGNQVEYFKNNPAVEFLEFRVAMIMPATTKPAIHLPVFIILI